MNAAIATPIAPVTAEIATAPAKITDWTEADFRAQVNVFVNSQKEFVNGVTRCTLYAVRAAMMNSNNQPLNYILGNLSEKLRPAWTSWLFYFAPFALSGGKDASTITLDDGTIVDLKSSIKLVAKRCDELCDAAEIDKLARDKGGNVNDPAGMMRLCDYVIGSLRSAPRFDTWKREKSTGRGDKPLTEEEVMTKYTSLANKLNKLIEQAKASGVHDVRKFPGIETPHGLEYYIQMLENADENDMSDDVLAKVRLLKGESLPFASLIKLMSNCDRSNLTPEHFFIEQELFYEEVLKSAVVHGIEL